MSGPYSVHYGRVYGPDEFRTEIATLAPGRDALVARLNEQHAEIERLRERLKELQAAWLPEDT